MRRGVQITLALGVAWSVHGCEDSTDGAPEGSTTGPEATATTPGPTTSGSSAGGSTSATTVGGGSTSTSASSGDATSTSAAGEDTEGTSGADSTTTELDEGTSLETSSTGIDNDGDSTGDTEPTRDYGPERDEFFGDTRCDAADVVMCDGFEAATIDEARWEPRVSSGNTLEPTTEYAARGERSIHIHADNGLAYLTVTNIFPMPGDRYWARMFVRFARFSTVSNAHWTVAEAAGEGDGSVIRIGGQYSNGQQENHWGVGSDHGPTGDWTRHDADPDGDPQPPATDAWICLEWLHDGQSDEARFFVDAIEHPSLATTSSDHGGANVPYDLPSFRSLWFGWWQYQEDPQPFDVWIDEIAVDTDRIGCKL